MGESYHAKTGSEICKSGGLVRNAGVVSSACIGLVSVSLIAAGEDYDVLGYALLPVVGIVLLMTWWDNSHRVKMRDELLERW